MLLPPCPISHSRIWKAQVHYLARHFRVVTYDGRGNGRSGHPDPSGPWLDHWAASDCLTVMDATETEAAVLAGICSDGVWPSVQIAAAHPERVSRLVALAPGVPLLTAPHPWRRPRTRPTTRSSTTRRGGRRRTAPTCAATTPASSSSSSARCSPSRTPPSTSRTPSPSGSTVRSRRWSWTTPSSSPRPGRRSRRSAGACAARCSSCTATATTASRSTAASRSPS